MGAVQVPQHPAQGVRGGELLPEKVTKFRGIPHGTDLVHQLLAKLVSLLLLTCVLHRSPSAVPGMIQAAGRSLLLLEGFQALVFKIPLPVQGDRPVL